jgi:hypothetical protein
VQGNLIYCQYPTLHPSLSTLSTNLVAALSISRLAGVSSRQRQQVRNLTYASHLVLIGRGPDRSTLIYRWPDDPDQRFIASPVSSLFAGRPRGVIATFGTLAAIGAASGWTSTDRPVDAKLLLPQHFPGPRQFRQAAVTDQPAGGVPERLACRWPPKLEIVQGGA